MPLRTTGLLSLVTLSAVLACSGGDPADGNGAAGSTSSAAATSDIIRVHGLHSSCLRDRRGWHRAYVWGRQACFPRHRHHRHHHGKKHWKKKH